MEPNSDVLFDWDNTLKKLDKSTNPPTLVCSVPKDVLYKLVTELNCRLFILTAISNSKLGIETLKIEVERLGLRDFFAKDSGDVIELQKTCSYGSFWRWGNCIVCGYSPKVGVYLHCCTNNNNNNNNNNNPVYFFDDEINNVECFKMNLPNSNVFHVTDDDDDSFAILDR